LVYTLTPMTPDEAQQFGLSEAERRSLIRMDSGKVNITPQAADAVWFKLVGVPLDNGNGLYPSGDNVQTIEPYKPPDTWTGMDSAVLNRILDDIDAGLPGGKSRYSTSANAKVRSAYGVVLKHTDKNETQAREIIKIWLKNGVIYNEEYFDESARKDFLGLRVNATKRPS
jgi:hypothetical protein